MPAALELLPGASGQEKAEWGGQEQQKGRQRPAPSFILSRYSQGCHREDGKKKKE